MKYILFTIASILFLSGCEEARFELATDSRLPKWFELPDGVDRDDVTVQLSYYQVPTEKSIFTLRHKNGKTISEVVAHRKGGYRSPKKLSSQLKDYPLYEVLIFDGITDIVLHKKMEPLFYLTNDKAIWKELNQ